MVSLASATQVPADELLLDEDEEDEALEDELDELEEEDEELAPPLELVEPLPPPPQPATTAAVPADARNASARRRSMTRLLIVCRSWASPRSCSSS